jgi:ADP-ribose pyrophosphatase YjhB (NUDIX family)
MNPIVKVAWIQLEAGHILSTRSRGKSVWYLPGGKPEAGETFEEALIREIREELQVELDPASVKRWDTFRAQAHDHPEGVMVEMWCYTATGTGTPAPAAEIEHMGWLTYDDYEQVSPVDQLIFDRLRAEGRL